MRQARSGATCAAVTLSLTLILLAACAVVAAFAGWRGARVWDPRRGPRMMPWRFIMITFAAVSVLLLIHVATLLGAPTPSGLLG